MNLLQAAGQGKLSDVPCCQHTDHQETKAKASACYGGLFIGDIACCTPKSRIGVFVPAVAYAECGGACTY